MELANFLWKKSKASTSNPHNILQGMIEMQNGNTKNTFILAKASVLFSCLFF
jgi:hypothetical protein